MLQEIKIKSKLAEFGRKEIDFSPYFWCFVSK